MWGRDQWFFWLRRTANVAIKRFTSECFSGRGLFASFADELIDAGVNESVVGSDGIFSNVDVFTGHTRRLEVITRGL